MPTNFQLNPLRKTPFSKEFENGVFHCLATNPAQLEHLILIVQKL